MAKGCYLKRRVGMKFLVILVFLFLPSFILADDSTLYDSPYGGSKIGRIDSHGNIYDDPLGGRKIGKVDS